MAAVYSESGSKPKEALMTVAAASQLVDRIVPEAGAGRLAAQIGLVVAGALLLWLSARIKVPFYPVPMTMQTFVVLALAASFGLRLGLATVLLYLAQGAAGLPVFTGTPEEGIGIAYMAGPTGGYLAGFVLATALVGALAERGLDRRPFALFAAMMAGQVLIFGLGLLWLAMLFGWDQPILAWGLYPFLLGDLVKTGLAAALVPAAARAARR
jgi:biotin transport system substrate-specific component